MIIVGIDIGKYNHEATIIDIQGVYGKLKIEQMEV
jgi:hypothetical protein